MTASFSCCSMRTKYRFSIIQTLNFFIVLHTDFLCLESSLVLLSRGLVAIVIPQVAVARAALHECILNSISAYRWISESSWRHLSKKQRTHGWMQCRNQVINQTRQNQEASSTSMPGGNVSPCMRGSCGGQAITLHRVPCCARGG